MGLGIYKKIKNIRPYKPVEYWKKRGKTYEQNFVYSPFFYEQEKKLVEILKILSFQSVLEFGCGFGRITKLILENFPVNKYTAIDLSKDQISKAKQNCKKFKNIDFEVNTIQNFINDNQFDLVISVEVLLHVLPQDIQSVIEKTVNLSWKNIINLDWYETIIPSKRDPHNFIHQYTQLYQKTGIKEIKEYQVNEKQVIFHAIKKS